MNTTKSTKHAYQAWDELEKRAWKRGGEGGGLKPSTKIKFAPALSCITKMTKFVRKNKKKWQWWWINFKYAQLLLIVSNYESSATFWQYVKRKNILSNLPEIKQNQRASLLHPVHLESSTAIRHGLPVNSWKTFRFCKAEKAVSYVPT